MPTRYIALLRGINVGGNNIIPMARLRASFEEMGFSGVTTYIASGNVVFTADGKATSRAKLTKTIESSLDEAFGYASRVVVLSAAEIAQVVAEAPAGFGKDKTRYRYDVIFVKPPLVASEVVGEVPTKEGVDVVVAGAHALYFRRVVAKATQSRLSKLVQLPLYKSVTIRNWNTTEKLAALSVG